MTFNQIIKSVRSLPTLDKSTYTRWASLFRMILVQFNAESVICNPFEAVVDTKKGENKYVDLDEIDCSVRFALLSAVPDDTYHLVENKLTSREMWVALEDYFKPGCEVTSTSLLKDFFRFTMPDGTSVDQFSEELTKRQRRIAAADPSFFPSDTHMWDYLLDHFDYCSNGQFSGSVTSLRRDKSCTFSQAVNSLRSTEATIKSRQSGPSAAFLSTPAKLQSIPDPISSSSSYSPNKDKTCAHCHRKGHTRDTCFLWISTPDGTKWAAKHPEKAAIVRSMFQKFGNKGSSKDKKGKSIKLDGAWMMEEHILTSNGSGKCNDVVLDTGATHHIFHDKSLFSSISPIDKRVQTASGQLLSVSGIGSVEISLGNYLDSSCSRILKLENVWYLPSCTKNLVSGSQILSAGYKMRSSNSGIGIFEAKGRLTATAHLRNGLFHFNVISPAVFSSSRPPFSCPLSSQPEDPTLPSDINQGLLTTASNMDANRLLHHRFAHVSPQLLSKVDISLVKLPNLKSQELSKLNICPKSLGNCDVCLSCKQVEKINRGPCNKSDQTLQLVHSDT